MSSWASFLPSCMHKMRTTCIQHPGRTASARCWRQFPIKRVLFALQPRTARDEAVCRCNPPWYHIPLICWVRLTCFFSENFTDPYFTWWTDLTAWHIQPVRWLDTSSDLGCLKIAKIGYPRTIMVQYFIFFPSQNCHANWAHNSIHFFETISSSPYSWLFIVYISLYPIMPCLHDGCLKPNSLSWATHDTHGKSPHCSWHIGISPFYHHRSSARMRKWLQWPPWKTLQHLPSSLVPRCQGDGLKAMAPSGKS